MTQRSVRTIDLPSTLTIGAIVAVCLPAVVLAYMPLADLPQHMAIASILKHHGDPAYGFDTYYLTDWFRVPYILPYLLAVGLSYVMPLAIAMRIVVFLSIIAYPLGVLALLRASRKPLWFALLAIPLVYNRSVWWGFLNFGMGIGLALGAFACFVSPKRTVGRDVLQAVLTIAATFCHIYGLAMIGGLVGAWIVLGGGYRDVRARPWLLAPLVAGGLLWLWRAGESRGYGAYYSPPLGKRLSELADSILGGYADRSELLVLVLFVAAWLALAWPAVPVTRAKLRALAPVERVAYVAFLGNLVAYFVLPQSTWTAKFIHFRHAFLALSLLPLTATEAALQRATLLVRALPAIAAVAALANSWGHLALFSREASTFDPIVAALPPAPKLVSVVFDRNGNLMANNPYIHYAAYAQAEKGGIISMTFPDFFWNLPVVRNPSSPVPETPWGFEWTPSRYSDKKFGYFYDYALVKIPGRLVPRATPEFPFTMIAQSPPWYLYKRDLTMSQSTATPSSP
jgi:hypothetical protein